MILDGKIVAQNLDNYVITKISANKNFYKGKYVSFLLFSDNEPSKVYIALKQKKAKKFGITTTVVFEPKISFDQAIKIVESLNNDSNCIGILIQLPLNENLRKYQGKLLSYVHPKKDIDGLGGVLFGLHQIEAISFLPATVRAIFELLYFYKISVAGKKVSVLGQSNLVGKPCALELIRQQATVFSFNEFSDQSFLKEITKQSDIIISATGKPYLIDSSYLNNKKFQILIDVGWGKLNQKPVGDFNFPEIFSKYSENDFMFTPVPGGIGPITVSSIFANLVDLQELNI